MAEVLGVALDIARQGKAIREDALKQSADAAKAVDAAHEVTRRAREQVKGRTGGNLPAVAETPDDLRLRLTQDHVLTSACLQLGDAAEVASARTEGPQARQEMGTKAVELRGHASKLAEAASNEFVGVVVESQREVVMSSVQRDDALHAPVYEAPSVASATAPTAELRAHEALPAEVTIETESGPRRVRFYSNAARVDSAAGDAPTVTIYFRSGPDAHDGWATVRSKDSYIAFYPDKRLCGLGRLGTWCLLTRNTMAYVTPDGAIWFPRGDGSEIVEMGPSGRVRLAPGGDEAEVTLQGRGVYRVRGLKQDAPQPGPAK